MAKSEKGIIKWKDPKDPNMVIYENSKYNKHRLIYEGNDVKHPFFGFQYEGSFEEVIMKYRELKKQLS